jgi:hypothetical protein
VWLPVQFIGMTLCMDAYAKLAEQLAGEQETCLHVSFRPVGSACPDSSATCTQYGFEYFTRAAQQAGLQPSV